MAYDLSKYKLQPGDRVRVLGRTGTEIEKRWTDGVHVYTWDFRKGDTGTIKRVWLSGGNNPPWVDVEPDKESGFGVSTFQVKELEKLA